MEFPCITLHRPWAAWVIAGLKPIETRTHNRFKGLAGKVIAIHAGKTYDQSALGSAVAYCSLSRLTDAAMEFNEIGVLGLVKVVSVRALGVGDAHGALIECATVQRFGLFMSEVRAFPRAYDVPGHQGIWTASIPDDLIQLAKVRAA